MTKYSAYQARDLDRLAALGTMSPAARLEMKAVAAVLPFRVNSYVVDQLIDWTRIPDDPIFQLTFPQRGMLEPEDFDRLHALLVRDAPREEIERAAREIQARMNPHPAGQTTLNIPTLKGRPLPGMQHKYRETVLFFPSQGQTCHAYCTYCFRWAQFVGIDELKFASRETDQLVDYLKAHREVESVLFTGGDPLIMTTKLLRRYLEPLLSSELEHVGSIRLGSKAPAYWPQRFTTDDDADELLRLFEEVVKAGKNLALMAHFSHPRELETPIAQQALRKITATGAVVRCQAPLIRHVNDQASIWAEMWKQEVRLGAVPYYMFVERDTGPKNYFEVPLARAVEIFSDAYRQISGLARTVRGPSMSTTAGKVVVDGITEIAGQKLFVLQFLQARDPSWVKRPFFALYDERATWFDQLQKLGHPNTSEPRFMNPLLPAATDPPPETHCSP